MPEKCKLESNVFIYNSAASAVVLVLYPRGNFTAALE